MSRKRCDRRVARRAGLFAGALLLSPVAASATEGGRPDAHAPIGVMGDHTHDAGEVMLSYRVMHMRMDGNRDGTDRIGDQAVILPRGRFLVTPTDMDMQMHMFGLMWAPVDRVTLMLMLPYVILTMDHTTAMGQEFTTRAKGLGDVSATALIRLLDSERTSLHAHLGMSFPSGSIDRKDNTPASGDEDVILPYPMQLGSGTFDFLPGLTLNHQWEHLSVGGQGRGTLRLGRNDENYRLGNRYELTTWGAVKVTPWMSLGGRVRFEQWFDVQGEDDRIPGITNMMGSFEAKQVVPTADPDLRGGLRLDAGPSLNLMAHEGPLKGLRLGFEALFPAYQNLDGPQLETDWTLIGGLQYTF